MIKVVAVNGSPRMEKGYTAMVLTAFLEGMKEAGIHVELFYTRQLNVKPCTGEFQCWYNKSGECYIQDSMQMIYPKLSEADLLVLATPVYIPLSGEMQNFINRLCAFIELILIKHNGRTRVQFHNNINIKQIALVSVCGQWENDNFSTVLSIVKDFARVVNVKFAGALLRPHQYLLDNNEKKKRENLEATKEAGFQLVREGHISEALLNTVAQPLISEDVFRQNENKRYLSSKRGE